jgi:hypothetical protein
MGRAVKTRLRVCRLFKEDVFKDIARIRKLDRADIREGSVCKISANGHTKHLIVRGLEEGSSGEIMLDELTRELLGKMEVGAAYDFSIEQSGPLAQLWWACTTADRGVRISAWIGVTSLALGALGAILGFVSLFIARNLSH